MLHLGSLENAEQALQVVSPLHVQLSLPATRKDDNDSDNIISLSYTGFFQQLSSAVISRQLEKR